MKNLEIVAKELFNKIRGRFPNVTVGNESAEITNEPNAGRFFEFDFTNGKKVSVSIDEKDLTIMYSKNLFAEDEEVLKSKWFDFMKEMRVFAKKRMLNFDTRDITKSNLDKRDYEYLSTEKTMSESKLYGTSRTSYQDIGTARMIVKHSAPVNQESVTGRNTNIHSIYIESEGGERFKYPYKHMNGARAMARHVSEGGNPYDDFGKHISGLSEELSNLRKFKTYMNRSSVMAEGLAQYMDVVNDRIATVKKTVESLQKQTGYAKTFENFETTVLEEVPEDVTANWIDELTIRQFNEELKSVFPYIYKLIGEANATVELGPEDLLGEGFDPDEFKGEFETTVSGDDGEEEGADIHYTAKIVNGKPVVDPKSIEVHAYGRNPSSKLGYDVENDTDMIMNYGGVDAEEIKREAQEDAEERWAERDNKYAHGESHVDERSEYEKYRNMRVVYDPATLEVKKTYPMTNKMQSQKDAEAMGMVATDGTKYLELKKQKQGMDSESIIDPEADYETHLDNIVANAKHEVNPQEEYERAFEDFKMAAANAAAKGEKDFEYPKGSGKKHPTKMDKGTAAKLLADSQTNEGGYKQAEIEVQDWFEKFNEYKGTNGDDLAQGWIRATLDTGIMADAYEEDELEAFNKMKGYKGLDADWQDGDHADFTSNKSGASPITAKMFSTINAIMDKYGIDEEQVDDMSKADDPSYGKPDMRDNESEKPTTIDISPKGSGDELKAKNEIPLDEFIKSLYDYTTNSFPKGETAVLTQVQKQYGDEALEEAQHVISELLQGADEEMAKIQKLAGLR